MSQNLQKHFDGVAGKPSATGKYASLRSFQRPTLDAGLPHAPQSDPTQPAPAQYTHLAAARTQRQVQSKQVSHRIQPLPSACGTFNTKQRFI
jgi:hypothetical protein